MEAARKVATESFKDPAVPHLWHHASAPSPVPSHTKDVIGKLGCAGMKLTAVNQLANLPTKRSSRGGDIGVLYFGQIIETVCNFFGATRQLHHEC